MWISFLLKNYLRLEEMISMSYKKTVYLVLMTFAINIGKYVFFIRNSAYK